jgi:hypothetical protein
MPRHADATPQLSFIIFVVLPLVALVSLAFVFDLWALLPRRSRGPRSNVRVVFALASALVLGAMLVRLFGYER